MGAASRAEDEKRAHLARQRKKAEEKLLHGGGLVSFLDRKALAMGEACFFIPPPIDLRVGVKGVAGPVQREVPVGPQCLLPPLTAR